MPMGGRNLEKAGQKSKNDSCIGVVIRIYHERDSTHSMTNEQRAIFCTCFLTVVRMYRCQSSLCCLFLQLETCAVCIF